ncbi:competence protein CoiA [Brevibacillus porteri]|uniref:competence protein CoiA n=1 Tax=Brevibacillus porteri TaxID=2126350 RepID=UPI003D1E08A0
MIRCITEDKKSLIATTCVEKSTRALSRAHKLFCPNCEGIVQYNKGKVKSSYFSHVNLECSYVGSEPETPSHIKGKETLYNWLKTKFSTAYIEYEVFISQTGQIADIYVEHRTGEFTGQVWAFEFQHSNITSAAWEERHNLYESAGIQDFWFFDKEKFMKFSSAKDNTDARKRSDLEKTVFNVTGLVYFLDLVTSDLTIDFKFIESPEAKVINGYRRTQIFTYHNPIQHSVNMTLVRARKSKKYDYTVLVSDSLEKNMESRLQFIHYSLEEKERVKRSSLYLERLREKGTYSRTTFGDEFAERFKSILIDHNGYITYWDKYYDEDDDGFDKELSALKEDIIGMGIAEFFSKYKTLVETSIKDAEDYAFFQESDEFDLRILSEFARLADFKRVGFLQEQGTMSLKQYLSGKYQDKIILAKYTYDNYRDVLDWLSTRNQDYVKELLSNINSILKVYKREPTSLDYAIQFKNLKSLEELEDCIQQIKFKIVNFNS